MTSKAELRKAIRERRRAALLPDRAAWLDAFAHDGESSSLFARLLALAKPGRVVAAFSPVGAEPAADALAVLFLSSGWDVIVPDPGPGRDQIRWRRVGEPTPGGGAANLFEAGLVIVPALGVDLSGTRLGQGGGWYDRALRAADRAAPLLAMVNPAELLPAGTIPREPHDVPMTHALLPTGVVALGR